MFENAFLFWIGGTPSFDGHGCCNLWRDCCWNYGGGGTRLIPKACARRCCWTSYNYKLPIKLLQIKFPFLASFSCCKLEDQLIQIPRCILLWSCARLVHCAYCALCEAWVPCHNARCLSCLYHVSRYFIESKVSFWQFVAKKWKKKMELMVKSQINWKMKMVVILIHKMWKKSLIQNWAMQSQMWSQTSDSTKKQTQNPMDYRCTFFWSVFHNWNLLAK